MPTFVPEHTVRLAAHRRLLAERERIAALLPGAEVLHVGSTSLPGAATKGDLDLAVRVPAPRFAEADAALAAAGYARNLGSTRSDDFAAFEGGGELALGVQLAAIDGAFDIFTHQRDALIADEELARAYRELKRRHDGGPMDVWRTAKSSFFDALAEAPAYAAARAGAPHRRRLERMYLGAPINRIFRPDILIAPGAAVVTAEATPALHHAAAGLHGSVFFKMLDDAAFFAVASQVEDVFVVTASLHTTLLRAIGEGAMRSAGRVVRRGAAIHVAEAVLFDPEGREAARAVGDFARSRTPLANVPAYR